MPKLDTLIKETLDEADKHLEDLAAIFMVSVYELRHSLVDIEALQDAIERGDEQGAIDATKVEELDNLLWGIGLGAILSYVNISQEAFHAGAKSAYAQLTPEQQKAMVYDAIGERGVKSLRIGLIDSVREVTSTTREGVSMAVKLATSAEKPIAQVAEEVKRLIGLTPNQMIAVSNYREQLQSKKNLSFTRVTDRRISAVDRQLAMEQLQVGNLTQAEIDKLVGNYYQSLLEKRAMDIARTEVMSMFNAGRQELWEQAVDAGILSEEERKFWIVTPDDKLRDQHAAIPPMNPYGVLIRAKFATPFGDIFGPQDRNVNLINCRCIAEIGSVLGTI